VYTCAAIFGAAGSIMAIDTIIARSHNWDGTTINLNGLPSAFNLTSTVSGFQYIVGTNEAVFSSGSTFYLSKAKMMNVSTSTGCIYRIIIAP
jgi:hypothetical protein